MRHRGSEAQVTAGPTRHSSAGPPKNDDTMKALHSALQKGRGDLLSELPRDISDLTEGGDGKEQGEAEAPTPTLQEVLHHA
ncbi:Protein of unknown function [Gryllus bimaculatus]|nr:Protein of unknown function [Gryllus bimaculatus]